MEHRRKRKKIHICMNYFQKNTNMYFKIKGVVNIAAAIWFRLTLLGGIFVKTTECKLFK